MAACQHCGAEHGTKATLCPRTRESMAKPGLLGAQVDRYVTEAYLGSGTFSAVYRARHVHTGSKVALKVLRKHLETGGDETVVERFLREARAAAAVGNDHIVQVVDAGRSPEGVSFVALEYLEGVGLDVLAKTDIAAPRAIALCDQVLEALEAAHQKGIIHRDMKPANVMVIQRNGHDFVKVLDFGISKMHTEDARQLTMTGTVMGTPAYMAPEQFIDASTVDQRADLYSVAVMLYELLAGQKPLEANTYAEMLIKIQSDEPVPLRKATMGLSAALADCVMRGLSKNKEGRWPSSAAFRAALMNAKTTGLFAPVAPSDAETVLMDDTVPSPARSVAPATMPPVDATLPPSQLDSTVPPVALQSTVTPPQASGFPVWLVLVVVVVLVGIVAAVLLR